MDLLNGAEQVTGPVKGCVASVRWTALPYEGDAKKVSRLKGSISNI
jgi:hypothetical protein